MKKLNLLMCLIFYLSFNAQVGVNTSTPSTTLQLNAASPDTKVEGLIVPRLTGDQIFNMPISVAQGYSAASSSNESNMVYATSAASLANQASTGRGEFLTGAGFYFWDHGSQKWRRLFVATSSSGGNDGVVRIDGQNGSATNKPTLSNVGTNNGFGAPQQIFYSGNLSYAASPTTSWPETIASPVDSDIYLSATGKFRENPINGQVHIWRVIVNLTAGASSAGSVMALLRNPDTGFEVNSVQLIPSGSSAGSILTFYFYTIADQGSLAPGRGYQLWLDANKVVSIAVQSVTRVSLFKD